MPSQRQRRGTKNLCGIAEPRGEKRPQRRRAPRHEYKYPGKRPTTYDSSVTVGLNCDVEGSAMDEMEGDTLHVRYTMTRGIPSYKQALTYLGIRCCES